MAPTDSLPIRLAQTIGLSTALLQSGANLTMSIFTIPRLLESPTPLMLRQWLNLYNQGKAMAPPIAIISALSFGYLSYQAHISDPTDTKAWAYAASALLTAGIVPYTMAFMLKTNEKLMRKQQEMKGLDLKDDVVEVGLGEETAHKLVDWWGVLNLGRGVMLGVAGVLGVWTVLN